MAEYIIGTETFKKNLDDWLFKNNQINANFLHVNRYKIPTVFRSYTQKLFRGMYADDDFLDKIEKAGSTTLTKHTSWTKDERIARKFVEDESFSVRRLNKDKTKIILSKIIPSTNQILDIHSFVLYMGVNQLMMLGYDEINLDSATKEKEILVSKGIKITKNDFKVL